ncbi:MAG: ABC transporter substrate-binding protein [Nitratireductor sp.]|nr:ABC transporter substrate-binding protein [Nitratireductor sp.]
MPVQPRADSNYSSARFFPHLHLASLGLLLFLTFLHSLANIARAEPDTWLHGGALFGELKHAKGFDHYPHVNPDAPKGGTFNAATYGGFDSFNPFVVQGRPAAGLTYSGGLLYDTLFEQAVDQPSASYGLIADAYKYSADYGSATYHIDERARWHDGKPITPEDVIWSLEVLKKNQPLYTQYFHNVVKAEKTGEHEVTFTFDIKGNRELPHILGDLPVLPKHWWEGTDANGKQRNIAEPLAEPPLGSGPYRIASFDMGQSIVWERVPDYWAADIGVRKGRYNFDRIKYTYFTDDNAVWEAFKKGGIEDLRRENRSQRWATEYTFPAFEAGDVKRAEFPTSGSETYQGFFFNTRKAKFADPRLREALSLLFDFETMNKNLFYGLYTRTDSYFEGGELQSSGLPQGREKEILESYKDRIDPRVLTEDWKLPVINSASDTRNVQREALRLLKQAGYEFKGGKMLDANGNQFEIEFLGDNPTDERITNPFIANLRRLGIKATLRIVDTAQYKNRLDKFDFDIITGLQRQSLSPGNEQREYWSSKSANSPGARNWAGISDPVVDDLVERIIVAKDREELVALTHALDRVLKWGFYSIPQWHNPSMWFAWWRKLQIPENQPPEAGLDTWSIWIDTAAEKEMER